MPSIHNKTPFEVQVLPLIDPQGRNIAVVIAKGTFDFDQDGGLRVASEQKPIIFADEFMAQPGLSPIRVPSDLTDFKPATDVILIRPQNELLRLRPGNSRVSVEIGPIRISGPLNDRWAFGPVRRDEKPRKNYAGTFDKEWTENRMPLLPHDFDPRYNQCAPPNQQARGYLKGDETVAIANLYSSVGLIETRLPGAAVVVAGNVRSQYFTEIAVLDTVLIWAEGQQLTLVWRNVIKPRQKFEEVRKLHIYRVRIETARELFGQNF
jgi:hypothetical protein